MEKDYKQFQEVADRLLAYLRSRDNERKRGEDDVWKRIELDIKRKKEFTLKRRLYFISTAAAILLLCFLSVEYRWFRESDSLDTYVASLDEPASNTSQIQLYLSSEEKVSVEENSASVSYSSKGSISINKKVRAETPSESKEPVYNQIIVPKGKYTHLTLSDGSTVHINSGTRVIYPRVFSADNREIFVEGEVCLQVTKNEKAPFIVKTASFNVEVLGTVFNVNAYKNDPANEVVLLKGAVRLSDQQNNKTELKPDQMATINNGNIKDVKPVDARDYIAWTEGLLILHTEPLSNVLKKMERFYGVSIQVSPGASALKMRGKIDLKQSLEDLLVIIASTAPISWSKTEEGYYIQKKDN